MRRLYDRGTVALAAVRADVVGADDGVVVKAIRRVARHNTEAYRANMMGSELRPGALADGEPDFLLQIGDDVGIVGSSAQATNGISYTPVTVAGKEGVFWVRTTSLGSYADYAKAPSMTGPVPPLKAAAGGTPWWVWAMVGTGALGAVAFTIMLARSYSTKRHEYAR